LLPLSPQSPPPQLSMSLSFSSSSTLLNTARPTPPWRSTDHASRTSRLLMPTSRFSTPRAAPPATATISFRTGPKKSSNALMPTSLYLENDPHQFKTRAVFPTPLQKLIGFLLATSSPSRTKANAAPAGLSPPLAELSPRTQSDVESNTFTTSPSNKSSPATQRVQVAMEVITILLGIIFATTPRSKTLPTPTHLETESPDLASTTHR